ncbi:MAG: glycoside hydrolase family 3 C-terminal domain-containing protein [Lachnospiraceae bacterium]|nr:glycoside hydrolase family 3 C-terminal domain-containing protein [Lachnospiraceae bacterium]
MNAYEKAHLKKLRRIAPECTLFLRRNGDFPLKGRGPLALYGSGARHTVIGGTGSGEVNVRHAVSIEEGLTAAGFEITTGAWLDAYDRVRAEAHKKFIARVHAEAKKAKQLAPIYAMGMTEPEPEYELSLDGEGDVAVYVLARISGEGNDRKAVPGDLLLSETEIRDIKALQAKYQKFLLVLNVGGPVDLSQVPEVENVLLLSQLGSETADVLADLISGKAYPSGKLATTWAKASDYCSVGTFDEEEETEYREGVYVGYRYFDTAGVKPEFPFGFGLGYTDFVVKPLEVSCEGSRVCVRAEAENTGSFWGKETVQLYASVPGERIDAPYQALAAFAKTKELKPGGSCEVSLSFDLRDLASFDEKESCFLLEAGRYVLHLGTSSADTRVCGIVRLAEDVVLRQVQKRCGEPGFTDWVPEKPRRAEVPEGTEEIVIGAEALAAAESPEDGTPAILPEIEKLPDETLAKLNVGGYPEGGLLTLGAIGNAASSVAGAAGETSRAAEEAGAGTLVMADGPAGLRLAKQYYVDKKGVHAMGQTMPQGVLDFLTPIQAFALRSLTPKPGRKTPVYEQYASAIPIGTAIAQSFSPETAEACGDIVGDEMERFGVHLWLAPALNIHRNVLCGRNFEYYSEDPLVSGLCAAAVTAGVQSHPGCGVTVKHYAANNQEYRRYTSDSRVSERAMREIYLRGFEICIRNAHPVSVMTSYNLLNGTHTSEHEGLGRILREEFGFAGIVMTDWLMMGTSAATEKHPAPEAWRIAAAGGQLVMPGSKRDVQNLTEALKSGKISRKQLVRNASGLIAWVRALTDAPLTEAVDEPSEEM